MRIVHLVPYFYPAWSFGGVPRAVYELALAQVARGDTVWVAASDLLAPGLPLSKACFEPADTVEMTGDGFQVHHKGISIVYYASRLNQLLSRYRVFYVPELDSALRLLFNRVNPEVIHVHELRTGFAAAGISVAATRNIPVVLSSHGSVFPRWDSCWKSFFKRVYDKTMGRRVLTRIRQFQVVSSIEFDDIQQLTGLSDTRIQIIPHGVKELFGLSMEDRKTLKDDLLRILFVGRIDPIKGIDLLLKVWRELIQTRSNAAMLITGEGRPRYLAELERQTDWVRSSDLNWRRGEIVYVGQIQTESVRRLMQQASCLVVPSHYEVWGLVILEALSVGCPVVATEACGCLEYLDGHPGVTVVPQDEYRPFVEILASMPAAPTQLPPLPESLTWRSVAEQIEHMYKMAHTPA